ncbi:alpha/beta fold hydrolase [Phenylobacterium aquaticum]|uniref:alpha/beta fold hydrolase n=1 Tax=Phenylobacterium aquaticum TaxID=1763816 RepID=UPI0026ED62EC|nr:alpha/beta hydrolase [Phenylobacterium aquaticum]
MVVRPDPGAGAPKASWRSGTVEISGGRLAFHRTGGSGPALLLSHGLTDNGLCWFRLAAALASDFDVIMLDARGHGESSRIRSEAAHDSGRDIAEAIDQLGLINPVVMGHSVGARATADFASAHPGRVSKVILEDPPLLPPARPASAEARRARFRDQVLAFSAMSEAEIIAMGKAASPSWHDDDFPAWAAAKKQVDPAALPAYDAPWQDAIAGITAPTLLICGEVDRGALVSPSLAMEAKAVNPNIRSVEIRHAGHNIRRENFTDYLSAVRAFLR